MLGAFVRTLKRPIFVRTSRRRTSDSSKRDRLRPRVRRQPLLTLVGPDAKASRPAPTPHRGPLSGGYGLRATTGWEVYSRNAPWPSDRVDRTRFTAHPDLPLVAAWSRLPNSRPVADLMRAPGMAGPLLSLLLNVAGIRGRVVHRALLSPAGAPCGERYDRARGPGSSARNGGDQHPGRLPRRPLGRAPDDGGRDTGDGGGT